MTRERRKSAYKTKSSKARKSISRVNGKVDINKCSMTTLKNVSETVMPNNINTKDFATAITTLIYNHSTVQT